MVFVWQDQAEEDQGEVDGGWHWSYHTWRAIGEESKRRSTSLSFDLGRQDFAQQSTCWQIWLDGYSWWRYSQILQTHQGIDNQKPLFFRSGSEPSSCHLCFLLQHLTHKWALLRRQHFLCQPVLWLKACHYIPGRFNSCSILLERAIWGRNGSTLDMKIEIVSALTFWSSAHFFLSFDCLSLFTLQAYLICSWQKSMPMGSILRLAQAISNWTHYSISRSSVSVS